MTAKVDMEAALGGLKPADLVAARDRFVADAGFLESLREEYTAKYPNQWVAAYAKEVFGPASTPNEVLTLLRVRGVDPGEASLTFLDPDYKRLLIL